MHVNDKFKKKKTALTFCKRLIITIMIKTKIKFWLFTLGWSLTRKKNAMCLIISRYYIL